MKTKLLLTLLGIIACIGIAQAQEATYTPPPITGVSDSTIWFFMVLFVLMIVFCGFLMFVLDPTQTTHAPIHKRSTVSPSPVWSTLNNPQVSRQLMHSQFNTQNANPVWTNPKPKPVVSSYSPTYTKKLTETCPSCGKPYVVYDSSHGGYYCMMCAANFGNNIPQGYQSYIKVKPPGHVTPNKYFLHINGNTIELTEGVKIKSLEVPGISPMITLSHIAEVVNKYPSMLLRNTSTAQWIVFNFSGNQVIRPNETISIQPGTRIKFGVYIGEVRAN